MNLPLKTNSIVEYLNSLDGSTIYDYDFLGQLFSADYANLNLNDESYSYDENGNRIVANGDNYITGTNNELTPTVLGLTYMTMKEIE